MVKLIIPFELTYNIGLNQMINIRLNQNIGLLRKT
jgi:hypothetical protein